MLYLFARSLHRYGADDISPPRPVPSQRWPPTSHAVPLCSRGGDGGGSRPPLPSCPATAATATAAAMSSAESGLFDFAHVVPNEPGNRPCRRKVGVHLRVEDTAAKTKRNKTKQKGPIKKTSKHEQKHGFLLGRYDRVLARGSNGAQYQRCTKVDVYYGGPY